MKNFIARYRIPLILLIATIALSGASAILNNLFKTANTPRFSIHQFNKELNARYEWSEKEISKVIRTIKEPDFQKLHDYSKKLPDNYSFYVLKNGSLVFWSNNFTPFEFTSHDSRIVTTPNGIFQQASDTSGAYRFILLDLIKHTYPYQNDYLPSSFNKSYKLHEGYQINHQKGTYPIIDASGNTLFFIEPDGSNLLLSWEQEVVLFIFHILTLLLLALSLASVLKHSKIPVFSSLFLLPVAIVFLRILTFQLGFPAYLKVFDIFSPLNYASSYWLPSLGDLLINSILGTFISFVIYRVINSPTDFCITGKFIKSAFIVISIAVITLIYYLVLYLTDTLIMNSSFELNLSRILDFSVYSIIAYFIIALLLLSLFFISYTFVKRSAGLIGAVRFLLVFIISSLVIWFSFSGLKWYVPQFYELVLFLVYIAFLVAISAKKLPFPHVTTSTLLTLLLTLISTLCLHHNKGAKELEQRKLMALRLSSDQDKVAEYLFTEVEKQVIKDSTLKIMFHNAWIDPIKEAACIEYIQSHYFGGYWTKYNTQITLCYPKKELEIKPSGMIIECSRYFNDIISSITDSTATKTLYYVRDSYGSNNYIARIPLISDKKDTASIVIEFTQKYVPKGLGYPELLLDKSFISFYDMSIYSYAIYSEEELIKNVGDYSYTISEKPFLPFKQDFRFFNKNGYNHLYHIINDKTAIIISKKQLSLLDNLAPFTYQLILHILIVFIFTTAFNFRSRKNKYPDLKSQLQIMLVALILFSSLIIGTTTLHNIKSLNNKKNQDMLSEKAHSVLIEIEHKLDTVSNLQNTPSGFLHELLTKFSLVFFSDINLYTTHGDLLATSRPEIFEEGLRSRYMSSEAFNQISENQRTFFVTNEQIGNYRYLSAYIPFRNKDNELVAYINLPYFAREHELRQEISSFLVTFVNVYIILTAIAVLVSLLIGNYVTRPLQLIKDQFSHVKLDGRNEKITYNRHDELGNLIIEYNLMLDKLAESADKLAKSERESAWKEMARQIAHEIKNPLTPMKLSMQHLYRSWKDGAPDWESKFEKTTSSVIQQIDSLAAIASAFSDFAKFPAPANENVELNELIRDNVALFSQNKNLTISFSHPEKPCLVYADKKQLSRVMVNLLNNAIQSLSAEKPGKIDLKLDKKLMSYVITITDNGSGIAEELKPKIFSPNFTTKSGGTGLGLAMVKNIITSANGTITFHSGTDGTTFEITLPAID